MNQLQADVAGKRSRLSWLAVSSLAILCVLIMLPRILAPQFGLFDDGRTVAVSRSILSGNLDNLWEPQSGRSRPVYWLYNAFLYALAGPSPSLFFIANLLILGLLAFGIGWLVLRLGGRPFQAWLSACLFAVSGPIVESFYTLSKPEPLQLLWILVAILGATFFILPFGSFRNATVLAGVTAALLLADLSKETSIVLLPISVAWWIVVLWRDRRRPASILQSASLGLMLAAILAGIAFGALRAHFSVMAATSNSYAANYVLSLRQAAASALRWGGWLLYDSTWLLPLLGFLGVRLLSHRAAGNGLWTLACMLWISAWLSVYLPWKYAVEYYLLPVAAGGAIAGGLAVTELARLAQANRGAWPVLPRVVLAASLSLLLGNGVNAVTNARVQLAVDGANQEMLGLLASSAPAGGTVLVNIREANEYVDEIRFHLAQLWGRTDLRVEAYSVQAQESASSPTLPAIVVAPFLKNEPSLSVRMGVVEATANAWNDSLLAILGDPSAPVFQSERQVPLLIMDYPRLLCPLMRAVSYCREPKPVIDLRVMDYGWKGFRIPSNASGAATSDPGEAGAIRESGRARTSSG